MSVGSIGSSTSFDSSQMAKEFLTKADVNGDGTIDKSELKTVLSNGPGGKTVTDAEVDKVFKEVDTNGDGKIDETENAAQMKKVSTGQSGTPPSGGAGQSGAAMSTGGNKVYDKRDLNKDGTVTAQEEAKYDLQHPGETKTAGYNSQGATNTASSAMSSLISLNA